jgi:hypothetical protein
MNPEAGFTGHRSGGTQVLRLFDPNLSRAVSEACMKQTAELAKPQRTISRVRLAAALFLGGLPIHEAKTLRTLEAATSGICFLNGLEALTQLREVYVDGYLWEGSPISRMGVPYTPNNISDLPPVRCLRELTVLAAQANQIGDLSPLAGLSNLRRLRLGKNRIEDLRPLALLDRMESLHLGSNHIRDIAPLRNLKTLRTLHLQHNNISDITVLWELTSLREVSINGNHCLDRTSHEDTVHRLVGRGVNVVDLLY